MKTVAFSHYKTALHTRSEAESPANFIVQKFSPPIPIQMPMPIPTLGGAAGVRMSTAHSGAVWRMTKHRIWQNVSEAGGKIASLGLGAFTFINCIPQRDSYFKYSAALKGN